MKIVADRDIPFLRGVLEPWAEVVCLRGDEIGPEDLRDADALLVRTRTRCNSALLAGSSVRFIGTATIGFDHIDMEWCRERGIHIATAAGCNRRGVLQWVAAALAWLAEGGVACNPSVKTDGNRALEMRASSTESRPSLKAGEASLEGDNNSKEFSSHRGLKPSETTLGVVGVGNVGSLVKEYAESWGFRVMCSDPPRERAEGLGPAEGFYPLRTLAAWCDIVTFHVPLTASGPDATRHIVDREFLAAAKPGAVILNSSRGAVIDPEALRESAERKFPSMRRRGGTKCRSGSIPFIIDTWDDEPAIDREVLQRVLLGTPHIAGYSVQGKAAATSMVVDALAREFGLPLLGWYPEGVPRSAPRAIGWEEMCRLMPSHFEIAAESAALKAAPERFEAMRNDYKYRTEYF